MDSSTSLSQLLTNLRNSCVGQTRSNFRGSAEPAIKNSIRPVCPMSKKENSTLACFRFNIEANIECRRVHLLYALFFFLRQRDLFLDFIHVVCIHIAFGQSKRPFRHKDTTRGILYFLFVQTIVNTVDTFGIWMCEHKHLHQFKLEHQLT